MRVALASILLAACTDSIPIDTTPPPPPGLPDIPDIGFHLPMTSLDAFSYTVNLEVGLDYYNVIVDTGSSSTGIAAAGCTACTGIHPLYTPGATGKDKGLSPDSSCPANLPVCTQYADGSGWAGKVFTDQSWLRGPFESLDFVAITVQENMFFDATGNTYQGILGMGPKELLETGTSSYMDALAKDYDQIETIAFRLCSFSGDMWLQGFDPTAAVSDPQYTPMLPIDPNTNPFYSIEMNDFSFGGTSLAYTKADFGATLVDTGTSISFIPTAAMTKLLNAINNDPTFKTLFPAQTLADTFTGDCVTTAGVTSEMVDSMLPVFTVTFPAVGGGTFGVDVPASQSYLYPAGDGQFCLAFSGSGTASTDGSLIGDTLLTGMLTVFDVKNQAIGFAPQAGCAPFDPLPPMMARAHHASPFFRAPPRHAVDR